MVVDVIHVAAMDEAYGTNAAADDDYFDNHDYDDDPSII